eukprot:bmy_07161T0
MLHGEDEHGLQKFYKTRSQIAESNPQGGFHCKNILEVFGIKSTELWPLMESEALTGGLIGVSDFIEFWTLVLIVTFLFPLKERKNSELCTDHLHGTRKPTRGISGGKEKERFRRLMMSSVATEGKLRQAVSLQGVDPETCMIVFTNHWAQELLLQTLSGGQGYPLTHLHFAVCQGQLVIQPSIIRESQYVFHSHRPPHPCQKCGAFKLGLRGWRACCVEVEPPFGQMRYCSPTLCDVKARAKGKEHSPKVEIKLPTFVTMINEQLQTSSFCSLTPSFNSHERETQNAHMYLVGGHGSYIFHEDLVVKILEKHDPLKNTQAKYGVIPPDEASAVQNYVEHMLFLLIEEQARDAAMGPILEFVVSENIMEKLFLWSLRREFTDETKMEQLKMYEMLITQSHQPLLHHKPILKPLMMLLSSCSGTTTPTVEGKLVVLLNQLCSILAKDPSILELFFHTSEDQGAANFLIFSLLIPFIHREGTVGQQARDALLFIMSLSAENSMVAHHIVENTYFCPDDWLLLPPLVQFMNSLEFCNAVIQVAHPLIRNQLVNYIYNGFLVPVLAPALHKVSDWLIKDTYTVLSSEDPCQVIGIDSRGRERSKEQRITCLLMKRPPLYIWTFHFLGLTFYRNQEHLIMATLKAGCGADGSSRLEQQVLVEDVHLLPFSAF